MPVSVDERALAQLQATLERFASGQALREAKHRMARETKTLVIEGFAAARAPNGAPWAPLKRGGGKPLQTLASTYRVVERGDGFTVVSTAPHSIYHQHGATYKPRVSSRGVRSRGHKLPARPMVPTGALPPEWEQRLIDAAFLLPLALSDIVTAVAANMATYQSGITTHTGAIYLANAQSVPPRVVWVPRGGPTSPSFNRNQNPREFMLRNLAVEIHCWGADVQGQGITQTEALASLVLASIYRVCYGYVEQPIQEEWRSEDGSGNSAFGSLCVLTATFQIPVTDASLDDVEIETATQTTEFE